MEKFIKVLNRDFPAITFVAGKTASWSPATQCITYSPGPSQTATWSLLHELGHALLGHASYASDVELLQKEVAAWEKAIEVAKGYGVAIDEEHLQACLDTYRDWLHKRSACPSCGQHGLQASQSLYNCLNCQNTWKVSSARFCRPYRLKTAQKVK